MSYLAELNGSLDKATNSLTEALTPKDAEVILGALREHINARLTEILKKTITEIEDRYDAIDSIEFATGRTLAVEFAVKQGITDETILSRVQECGYFMAALWLQLELEDERMMLANDTTDDSY